MNVEIHPLQRHSPQKVAIIATILVLILAFVVCVGLSIYVGLSLIHPKRQPIDETPDTYSLTFKDIQFTSRIDSTNLKGWWIPAQKDKHLIPSSKTVIFAHGYGDNRVLKPLHVLRLAQRLSTEGYNVLLFDFRHSGESAGEAASIGQFEKYDLLAAIDYAKKVEKSDKIALLGWSMGAVTSILAGTESPDVTAVIADSPFADLTEYLEANLPVWSGLPNFPFTPMIMNTIPLLAGINPKEVSPYQAVKHLGTRHLLLIHSKGDKKIPYQDSERIYRSIPDPSKAEIWITEKADHIKTYLLQKKEYEDKILTFLSSTM